MHGNFLTNPDKVSRNEHFLDNIAAMTDNEIILINISGRDKPGVTAAMTEILTRYNTNVLDIGQSLIHDNLSLSILVEVPAEPGSSPLLKDLLFIPYIRMGVAKCDFFTINFCMRQPAGVGRGWWWG